jgi:hypothetical protein
VGWPNGCNISARIDFFREMQMRSKHKALFALAVFMIGMLNASDAEAGLFFRGSVFGRIRERIAERRERRFERLERRLERLEPASRAPQSANKAKPRGPANPAVPGNAPDVGAPAPGAAGGGQNQIAAQQVGPVAPQDVCNVRLVRCSEQENAETKEKTPFCQVRSTPVGSPEEVLRVMRNGTLVVMREEGGLTATTPEMVRFLGAEYEAIAAQQAQAGGGVNPLITAFRTRNQALLGAAPQACVGGLNNFGSLAFNQNPGFTPEPQPLLPTPPFSTPTPPPVQQDQGGGDPFDPAGLGEAQVENTSLRGLASRQADSHSAGPIAATRTKVKRRPVVDDLAQRAPTKPLSGGGPTLLGSPFQSRSVVQ